MPATDDCAERIRGTLEAVEVPEIDMALRNLGSVRGFSITDGAFQATLVPTRLGYPGREIMARRIRETVAVIGGRLDVDITWNRQSWDATIVTGRGCCVRIELAYTSGVTRDVRSPYCDSAEVHRDGQFGGPICTTPFRCRSCASTSAGVFGSVHPLLPVEADG